MLKEEAGEEEKEEEEEEEEEHFTTSDSALVGGAQSVVVATFSNLKGVDVSGSRGWANEGRAAYFSDDEPGRRSPKRQQKKRVRDEWDKASHLSVGLPPSYTPRA